MNIKRRKEKINKQLQNWKQEKQILQIQHSLKEEKKQFKNKKTMSTSKFLMLFLFISCTAIEVFTMYVTVKGMNMGLGADFTPLQMLITSVVAQVVGFAVYSLKALKENTKGGVVYQTALLNNNNDQEAVG